jgi:hypothetical protein
VSVGVVAVPVERVDAEDEEFAIRRRILNRLRLSVIEMMLVETRTLLLPSSSDGSVLAWGQPRLMVVSVSLDANHGAVVVVVVEDVILVRDVVGGVVIHPAALVEVGPTLPNQLPRLRPDMLNHKRRKRTLILLQSLLEDSCAMTVRADLAGAAVGEASETWVVVVVEAAKDVRSAKAMLLPAIIQLLRRLQHRRRRRRRPRKPPHTRHMSK